MQCVQSLIQTQALCHVFYPCTMWRLLISYESASEVLAQVLIFVFLFHYGDCSAGWCKQE